MFLGIDIGTSAVKAVIVDADGRVVTTSSRPLPISRPAPGQSEQDPEDWWQTTLNAVGALDADLRGAVSGVGLSGQMHGAVLLGADDRPLRPAILWNDGRSTQECAELEAAEPDSRIISGNLAMPGFTAPKLLWIRRYEPEIFRSIACVLLPKDYVRLRLTGYRVTDMSDASGTMWLDVHGRDWSEKMIDATGLQLIQMPRLVEGCDVAGMLTKEAGTALGVPPVPVVGGAGDNAGAAIGMGCVRDGLGFLSLGTSGVLFLATETFRPHPERGVHAFCHALPNLWHQMAVILSAASAVEWAARLTGFADVAAAVAAAKTSSGRATPIFLPYLSGERTPHNDAQARGAFFGLSVETEPGDLIRATMEGVAFALADGANALREGGGTFDALDVVGGGAGSRWWGRIVAAVLGVPLDVRAGAETGPALGAARLAALGCGVDADIALRRPALIDRLEPDPDAFPDIDARRAQFHALYPAVRPIFRLENTT